MSTTYTIPTIRPELETGMMVVFYKFSNGENFTNRIPFDTPVPEIQQWGEDKCKWFDEREITLQELQQQLIEPIIELPIEPITE